MSMIMWLIFGALSGWIASLLTGTPESQGTVGNIIVGIVGAIIGGFLMSLIGKRGVSGFNFYSAIVAVLGSVILLNIYKAVAKRG